MQGEPDNQQGGQSNLAARRAAPDREALTEVVQADADGDQQGHAACSRPRANTVGGLVVGHGTGADGA